MWIVLQTGDDISTVCDLTESQIVTCVIVHSQIIHHFHDSQANPSDLCAGKKASILSPCLLEEDAGSDVGIPDREVCALSALSAPSPVFALYIQHASSSEVGSLCSSWTVIVELILCTVPPSNIIGHNQLIQLVTSRRWKPCASSSTPFLHILLILLFIYI